MEILNKQTDDSGMFYVLSNGERLARLDYHLEDDDRLVIEHTEVSPLLKGKGVGKQLVDEAVKFARKNKMKIIPLCAFARSVFQKFKGYEDVL